jgi:hypothetical protein
LRSCCKAACTGWVALREIDTEVFVIQLVKFYDFRFESGGIRIGQMVGDNFHFAFLLQGSLHRMGHVQNHKEILFEMNVPVE